MPPDHLNIYQLHYKSDVCAMEETYMFTGPCNRNEARSNIALNAYAEKRMLGEVNNCSSLIGGTYGLRNVKHDLERLEE